MLVMLSLQLVRLPTSLPLFILRRFNITKEREFKYLILKDDIIICNTRFSTIFMVMIPKENSFY
jgi:hypothetical protein